VLKTVEWMHLDAATELFMRALFEDLLNPPAEGTENEHNAASNIDAIFRRIAAGASRALIHDGISSFFDGVLKKSGFGRKPDAAQSAAEQAVQRERRERFKRAKRCLKEVRAFQHAAAAGGALGGQGGGLSAHRDLELDEMMRGNGVAQVIEGNIITVAYRGCLDTFTGAEFDSSSSFKFTFGAGDVIEAWDLGLRGAKGACFTCWLRARLGGGAGSRCCCASRTLTCMLTPLPSLSRASPYQTTLRVPHAHLRARSWKQANDARRPEHLLRRGRNAAEDSTELDALLRNHDSQHRSADGVAAPRVSSALVL
jgi:FKBP-type peptidyl-prolyl cis-trans isomerase